MSEMVLETDIDRIVRGFEECTIPRSEWTHRAHLVVALVYLLRYGAEEGGRRIRSGILSYAARHGIEQTATGGYHETMTQFYIRVVQRFIEEADVGRSVSALADELYDRYGDRELPWRYYSKALLMSWEARTEWRAPDLRPLP